MTMVLTPEQRAAATAVAEAASLLSRAMSEAAELGLVVDVSFGRPSGDQKVPPALPRRGRVSGPYEGGKGGHAG